MRRLTMRLDRLNRLVDAQAPDTLIAAEAMLVGEAGILLDPQSWANTQAERIVFAHRDSLGLCLDCDSPRVAETALCQSHLDELTSEIDDAPVERTLKLV